MKSLVAILLMAVFASSQYGKHLAYIDCKLANSIKPSAQQCDCEKKYTIHIQDDKPVAHQTNFSAPVDELYSPLTIEVIVNRFSFPPAKPVAFPLANVCKGNCTTPHRPPQAYIFFSSCI